jgi:hypothetical protein
MESLKIINSLDWPRIEAELMHKGKMLPEFSRDTNRLLENIRKEVTKLAQIEVNYRRTKSDGVWYSCQEQAEKINELISLYNSYHMIGLLVHR